MAAAANMYANAIDQAFTKNISWSSDTIKMALLTSSYTPNLVTHVHYADLTNEVASGGGYTTGGATLGTMTHTVTAANSFAVSNGLFTSGAWIASTAAVAGNVVHPISTNGFLYVCVAAGTTGASAPTWPTVQGATVVDSGATWSCIGESITLWGSASPTWTSSTISAAYGAIYDSTTPFALVYLYSFGSTVSSTSSTFTVNTPALGWFWTTPN